MIYVATPVEALLGGISLGLLAVGRLLIHGKILGISGHIRGILKGSPDKSQTAHLVGLAAGGACLTLLNPACFGILPATYTVGRAAFAGLLVGSGAALGNGCTSGHGLCGTARLSPRSLGFTVISVSSGVLIARLTGTAQALGLPSGTPKLKLPGTPQLLIGLALVGGTAAVLGTIAALVRRDNADRSPGDNSEAKQISLAADVAEGLLFALALGYAGMTNPGKVAAFLNMTLAGFDYSLAFVMGGGVLIAMGPFLRVFKGKKPAKSLTGKPMPVAKTVIDGRLVLGAVLFGAGWGLGGICPGPGVASLATLSKQILAFSATTTAAIIAVP